MDNTRYKIALVDDNMAALNQGKSLLQDLYSVYTIQSPLTLFGNLEHFMPDLILLDLEMPEMSGFEVLSKLKADPRYKNIPVIFLTAKRNEESERKGFELGVSDYITKPFSPAILRLRVRNQINMLEQMHAIEYEMVKYRLVSEAMGLALWDMEIVNPGQVSLDDKFYWSQEFRHMLGFNDESDFPNILLSLDDRLHPDDKERTRKTFAAHLNDYSGNTPYDLEYRIKHKNGEYRDFHAFGTTLRASGGIPLRISGAIKDITELKKMQKAIADANERVNLMLDSTPLCIQLWNRELKTIDCNEAAVRLYGFKSKQEYIERFLECSPEYQDDGQISTEKAIMLVKKAFDKGECTFNWMHRIPDTGELMPAEVSLVRVKYINDYVVAGYTRDLREHNKMMELILEEEERLQLMLNAMPMACRLFGRNYKFIDCNQQALDMVAAADKEEFQKKIMDIIPEFQICGRKSDELRMEYLNTAFDKGYLNFEWLYVLPDGEPLPCEVTMVRVIYKGEYIIAAYLRDLREQKAIIEEMRKAEVAEESNKAKSRFLANMSHEMRTPLNVIVGFTDLMLEEESLAPKLEKKLKNVSIAGNTLLGLINDVLDISKIEADKLELTPVNYGVPSLINDIITLNMIRIEEKPITFHLDISENLLCRLCGDDLRVKQIINNLLSNAIKYTQKGAVSLGLVTERMGDEDVRMEIIVSDTGIGISKDDLKKIFTDYGQVNTRTSRKVEGTGLGLAITKRLVEMMGGEISVESELGKGSVFRAYIQQKAIDNMTIGPMLMESLKNFRYSEDKNTGGKKFVRDDLSFAKVLVVDDVQPNLDLAAGLLSKYKMHVDCVLSGEEAVDLISRSETSEQQHYNAIFMDHMMPGMDGIETAKAIRNIGTEYAGGIPIIALTANAIAGAEDMFLDNGFQGFIPKPINIKKLDSMLKRWIHPNFAEPDEVESDFSYNKGEGK